MSKKVVLLGDLHFGLKKDSDIFSDYFYRFFDDVFFPYLEEHGITSVVQLGDLLHHRKYLNAKTFDNVHKRYFQQFEDKEITLYQMLGNHDVYYKNTNEVNWISNLLRNSKYEYVKFIEKEQTVHIDGEDFDIIPWINEQNSESIFDFMEKSESKFLLGHLELSGFVVVKGHESQHGLSASKFKKYDKVFTGHYHIKSEKGNIVYTGIPYEMSWSDCDDPKGFYVFDTETHNYDFIRNHDVLFRKIEYTDKFDSFDAEPHDYKQYENCYVKVVIKQKSDEKRYNNFLTRLTSIDMIDLSIIDGTMSNQDDIDIEDFEIEDTLTILRNFVSKNLSESYNESNILSHIDDLYQEANILMKDTA